MPCCEKFTKREVHHQALTTVGGERLSCDWVGRVTVETSAGQRAEISALVMDRRPLDVEMILSVDGISALGGVIVKSPSDVVFCGVAVAPGARLSVDVPDYEVHFDDQEKIWKVSWKWSEGSAPECLKNQAAACKIPENIRADFDGELPVEA